MSVARTNTLAETDSWLLRQPVRAQASVRLLCVPYAGGNAWMFRQWASRLPETIEVCAVQLPGHVGRMSEAAITDFATLLSLLADALRLEVGGPVALFGHSLGALVAFELARSMRDRSGREALHLFVSGHNAPQAPREGDTDLDDSIELDDETIVEKLRRLGCTPEAVLQNREMRQLMLPILRADFALYRSYAYRESEPLCCPITVFGGLQDPHTDGAGLDAWRRQTRGPCRVQLVSGDHFFVVAQEESVVQAIAGELRGQGNSDYNVAL